MFSGLTSIALILLLVFLSQVFSKLYFLQFDLSSLVEEISAVL